jgi:hypothetical protein
MQQISLAERLGTHIRNLGRLSVSILEYYVGQLTGENAIKILGEPYEREKRLFLLMDVLAKTEKEIREEHLIPVKYLDVHFRNPAEFVGVLDSFQNDIDIDALTENLQFEFSFTFPHELPENLYASASVYATTLQKKMVAASDESLASRITATTLLDIRQLLSQQISDTQTSSEQVSLLKGIAELLQRILAQNSMADHSKKKPSKVSKRTSAVVPNHWEYSSGDVVFICYAHNDENEIHDLTSRLEKDKINVWVDYKNLLGGNDWDLEISKSIQIAKAVLICLSSRSIQTEGYVQKEIRRALDQSQEKPEGKIYIIPVRFDKCSIPEALQQWHSIDLYEDNGYAKLIETLFVIFGEGDKAPKKEYKPTPSTLDDLQQAVFACASIYSRSDELYRKSGFPGYKSGAEVEMNIGNLVSQYINRAGTMLLLIKEIGKSEGARDGSSFTESYWDLLKTWWRFKKSKEEQDEYVAWLEQLRVNLRNIQKVKLEDILRNVG